MKIKLANSYLVPAINFLQAIKLKGADSIARSKMVKLLNKSLESLQDAEKELINQFGERKDNNKPVTEDNPLTRENDGRVKIQPAKLDEYLHAHTILMKQVAEVEGGTYVNHIDDVAHLVDNYAANHELDGQDAEAYFGLHESFSIAKKEKN
ncbi:hypothetical protein [Lacticaseibacillus yichunensis]|uniref:DUF1617 family protein n=1 Tax=Lacticaseibacillus yichunensis TaxID=2486015 RepID=A0ABW4CMZ0_9LACO|nr:hypothetical protein [Lacticaseibacillus yichunensis]